MFEECRSRYSGHAGGCGPKTPALIVFEGCPEHKRFTTMLRVGAAGVWSVMDEGLHPDGDKRMLVVVVVAVDMCKGRNAWVRVRLAEEQELAFHLWKQLAPQVHGHVW